MNPQQLKDRIKSLEIELEGLEKDRATAVSRVTKKKQEIAAVKDELLKAYETSKTSK